MRGLKKRIHHGDSGNLLITRALISGSGNLDNQEKVTDITILVYDALEPFIKGNVLFLA